MTIPLTLTLTLDAAAMGAEHVGYRVRVPLKGNGTVEPVTIARVLPLYNRPHHVRLEFAEYPGYHYDITGQVMLCAAVKPVPAKPAMPATPESVVDLVAQAIHSALCTPLTCVSADMYDAAARAVLVALAGAGHLRDEGDGYWIGHE